MNVWNWLSQNFVNGEIFFYIVPLFLFIVLILVIFLPEKKEISESKPEKDKDLEKGIDFVKKEEPYLETFRRNTIDLSMPKEESFSESEEKNREELVKTVSDALKEAEKESSHQEIETSAVSEANEEKKSEDLQEEPAKNFYQGLEQTRGGFISKLKNLFKSSVIDDDLIDQMEEILYTADIGVETVSYFMTEIHKKRKEFKSGDDVKLFLKEMIRDILRPIEKNLEPGENNPSVILMVGVNGAGKTTTIGKLSKKFKDAGKSIVLAAGDTFRAAAVEQLKEWGARNDVEVISEKEGADPAAVAYNAINSALSKNKDIVIVDTAGRLQNRVNLMEELKKVHRVIGKAKEGAPHEVILVVDANNGQNALLQAKQFNEAVNLTGIIITKLDGTAKGGVIIGIAKELKIPIYFIGVGEKVNDLRRFNADEFTEALFE